MSLIGCYICGAITSDDVLGITPYGLLPICGEQCLKTVCNADTMPPRLKELYEQQQRDQKKERIS